MTDLAPFVVAPGVTYCGDCNSTTWRERNPVEGQRPVQLVQHDQTCGWAKAHLTPGEPLLIDYPDLVVGHGLKDVRYNG